MRFLKASAVGILVGVVAAIIWTYASLQVQISWQMWQQRGQGGGLGAASVNEIETLGAAVVGFALGFFWMMRRSARTT